MEALSNPVFSIIMPCFNQANFLEDAITSVLDQDFWNWELILINDGSTDSSAQLADNFARLDARIQVIHQTNHGLSNARNVGLGLSRGKYLGFLDADDIYLPGAFQQIFLRFIDTDSDLIIGGYRYFKEGNFFHTHRFSEIQIQPSLLLERNQAPPVAHFLKKEVALKVGEFDSNLTSCEDWDYWIRIAKFGAKIHTVPDVIAGYRYVFTSMSRNPLTMYQALSEVSQRAFRKDTRLSEAATFNKEINVDFAPIQKKNLIRCLGISIHQGKANEAAQWFLEENKFWMWDVTPSEWQGLSSTLSWRYFLEENEIEEIFSKVQPSLRIFFSELGYSAPESRRLIDKILRPQSKRLNHYRYGKWIGALINRISN